MVFTIYGGGGHLGPVTNILYIYFGYIIIRSLHMKFDFNWANGLWENYVLIYWWDSNKSDLKLKGQRSTLTFGTYL